MAVMQTSVVAEFHDDVRHNSADSFADPVNSMLPKAKPVTVTDAPPLCGAFSSPYDDTGASKLYPSTWVPATAPTVNAEVDTLRCIKSTLDVHATDVDELHESVKQTPSDKLALAVCSPTPKPRPINVTAPPPLTGEFRRPYDATGASKLSTGCPVPATAPTVTALYPNMCLVLALKHCMVVADCQDVVMHAPCSTPPVLV
jgi:hypothetical protein